MNSATPTIAGTGPRRPELDVIRTSIVGGLVFFHTACIFVPGQFYLSNRSTSHLMTIMIFFIKLWAMPLVFMVAGAGIWHSLRTRTAGAFIGERLTRLLVPLLVGTVLLVPPQIYLGLRARGLDPESYWHFVGRFFDVRVIPSFPSFLHGADPDALFELGHLWFLYYLLVYSLLLLPLFLYLRDDPERLGGSWAVARCRRPGGVIVLALPVLLLESLLGTWGEGGWNNFAYLMFLFYGFLVAAVPRMAEAIGQGWRRTLPVAIVLLPILYAIAHLDVGGPDRMLGSDLDPWSILWRLLKATSGWAWTFTIFGLAISLLQRSPRGGAARPAGAADRLGASAGSGLVARSRTTRYAREAVLPFYVLHQTPIVVIGYYVIRWETGILPKYLAISVTSLLLTLLVYDMCVRRARLTRMLFGMPRRHRSGGAQAAVAVVGNTASDRSGT